MQSGNRELAFRWALIICAGLMVLSTVANVIIYAVRRVRAARSAAAVALAR